MPAQNNDKQQGHTSRSQTIVQRGNTVYLQVRDQQAQEVWYAYDASKKPIGEGGMGKVYKGWRTDTNTPVAIKQVAPQFADIPTIRQRARLEASMEFNHSHVVEMLGLCEWKHDSGPMFIISGWVNGITLDNYIKDYKIRTLDDATRKICETIYPVLDALTFLHKHDIIHMDVKPSNIMVEKGYNIRLMDLGIIHTHDAVAVTSPGIIGTPKYAAPEQVITPADACLHIDRTTDIYQLGVTLYELLTGSNPYDAPEVSQIIVKHRTEQLPPIAGVSRHVMQVLHKATSLRQPDRYQTAQEFKAALQAALEHNSCFFSRIRASLFG